MYTDMSSSVRQILKHQMHMHAMYGTPVDEQVSIDLVWHTHPENAAKIKWQARFPGTKAMFGALPQHTDCQGQANATAAEPMMSQEAESLFIPPVLRVDGFC